MGLVFSARLVKLISGSYAAVTLELRKKGKQSIIGLLSVQLGVVDVPQATKAVLSNVLKDVTETPLSVPDHLCNVVSKISILADILDEASKACTGTLSLIATIHDFCHNRSIHMPISLGKLSHLSTTSVANLLVPEQDS